MDGRKGFRRLREPPPGTRSSRRGRRAHDPSGRVKGNRHVNHPPPQHHHHVHEDLKYGRGGPDQEYNGVYERTDFHHPYEPGQADPSSGGSGYHQPPSGEVHLSSNSILLFGDNALLCI